MAVIRQEIVDAWRIADGRFPVFDGMGAKMRGARWNSAGHSLIYCGDSLALCVLEILAHAGTELPPTYQYVHVTSMEPVSVEEVEAGDVPDWREPNSFGARIYGDRWAIEQRSLILMVPSIVVPNGEKNLVVNQVHPEFAKLVASIPVDMAWDARLAGRQ